MSLMEKRTPLRALLFIAPPKLTNRAAEMFHRGSVPIQYQWNAVGTAPSETLDILGLGNPEKRILLCTLPRIFANEMLKKLEHDLNLDAVGSGIAFTIPISGANALILRLLEQLDDAEGTEEPQKEETSVNSTQYSLIVAVFNKGYSEEVMAAAREAGASGGTVVNGRRIGNEDAMGFWGMSIQDEKDMLFIVAENGKKLEIMRSIGKKCGIHSNAKGIVLSLPIDAVTGLK